MANDRLSRQDSDDTFARPNRPSPREIAEPISKHRLHLRLECDVARCHDLATYEVQTYREAHGSVWLFFCSAHLPKDTSNLRDFAESRMAEEIAIVEGFRL